MNILYKLSGRILISCCMFLFANVGMASAVPIEHQSFKEFLNSFYAEAAKKGITRSTYDSAFADVKEPYADVLKKAEYQPE